MAQPSAAATLLPSTSLSRVECHGKANGNFPNQNLSTTTNTIYRFESTRRPSLVNSLPFPCHSVLPSSAFLLAQESTDISSINLNRSSSPINKISLWPWEPTPLYLQLQRHFLPIWHWNLNRIHPLLLIFICRKQSSLHCLFVLYFP